MSQISNILRAIRLRRCTARWPAVSVYCWLAAAPALAAPSTAPSERNELEVLVGARIWDPDRDPSLTVALYCACSPGDRHDGEKLPVLDDQWGQDWTTDPYDITGRARARGEGSAAAGHTQVPNVPRSFIALFFDETDKAGRHVGYPGAPPDGYDGFVVPMVGSWDEVKLAREGAFCWSTADWCDAHLASSINLRAVLVLDGKLQLTSSPVKIAVRPSGAATSKTPGEWIRNAAEGPQVLGAPIPQARLAIEQLVPEGPARAGLLKEIDGFEAESSELLCANIEEPLGAASMLQSDGDQLRQAVESGVPAALHDAVARRASILAEQFRVLGLVGGGGEALANIYSRRLGLNAKQREAAIAIFHSLDSSRDAAATQPASGPTTPYGQSPALAAAYRSFRALLTPAQCGLFDGRD